MFRIAKITLALVTVALTIRIPAHAQGETTSAIAGTVSDPAGAPISAAKVTITSADTGLTRSVKTDPSGRFNFPQLKPGRYSVKVEADEFEPT